MAKIVTPEEETELRRLNRLRMKIYRDKNRKRKYSPHPTVMKKKNISSVETNQGDKNE